MSHRNPPKSHPDANLLAGVSLTPIQSRIVRLLSDGLPHTRAELLTCLGDPHITSSQETMIQAWPAIGVHLTYLRKKIRPLGHDIVCVVVNRAYLYQHIIKLPAAKPSSGKI